MSVTHSLKKTFCRNVRIKSIPDPAQVFPYHLYTHLSYYYSQNTILLYSILLTTLLLSPYSRSLEPLTEVLDALATAAVKWGDAETPTIKSRAL